MAALLRYVIRCDVRKMKDSKKRRVTSKRRGRRGRERGKRLQQWEMWPSSRGIRALSRQQPSLFFFFFT